MFQSIPAAEGLSRSHDKSNEMCSKYTFTNNDVQMCISGFFFSSSKTKHSNYFTLYFTPTLPAPLKSVAAKRSNS